MGSIRENFKKVIGGYNFMTPSIKGYYQGGDYAIELSEGTTFEGRPLYGVTVANIKTGNPEYSLSDSFESEEAAFNHMKKLGVNSNA